MAKPIRKRGTLKENLPTLNRLLKLIFTSHPVILLMAFAGIIVNAAAGVWGSLFLQRLFDDYITPLVKSSHPNFIHLIHALLIMGGIYLLGVLAAALYTQLMAVLAQKIQLSLRKKMFAHMQTLAISYFDRNNFGDLMSRYTNDIDALLQMISRAWQAWRGQGGQAGPGGVRRCAVGRGGARRGGDRRGSTRWGEAR